MPLPLISNTTTFIDDVLFVMSGCSDVKRFLSVLKQTEKILIYLKISVLK